MPKFAPQKPLTFFEEGTHFGNPSKGSAFLSDLIETQVSIGGVTMHIYRFKGTFDQNRNAMGTKHTETDTQDEPTDIGSFLGVQDTVLNESRDREYDFDEIPRLKGVYTTSQNEVEYARFGLALTGDVITMEVHTQSMERECGRRLIPGDVIELPHLRDVGIDGRIANKWYEVSSLVWSPTGHDPFYGRHVHAVILKPLRHQQEFLDILERHDEYGKTIADQTSDFDYKMNVTTANQELANEYASTTWQDTTLIYIDPEDQTPHRWTDDGKPPNGLPVDQGTEFPADAEDGSWFLRTDLVPNKLYQLSGNRWRLREYDRKRDWQPYNWVEKLREHMSDRSTEDRERPWELRSIHDVITDREYRSDPTGESEDETE